MYLKNVDSLNLATNRFAALLPSERRLLEDVAGPLGVVKGGGSTSFFFHCLAMNFGGQYLTENCLLSGSPA